MTTETLGATTVLLLLAYVAARLTRRHVPELVGYLVVGALLGPTGVGLFSRTELHALQPLTVIPVAVLMFVIGERISLTSLRAAPWVAVVAPMSYALTGIFVLCAARVAGASMTLAAFLGVLAGGGAPMTVAAVVGRGHAATPFGKALIGLHASCDALAALTFAVVFPIVDVTAGARRAHPDLLHAVLKLGVAGVLLGVMLGISLSRVCAGARSHRQITIATVIHVVAAGAISAALGFSVPLAALVMGAVAASRMGHERSGRLFNSISRTEPWLYLLFFTLGGAAIRINALPAMGLVGAAYIAGRTCGKLIGALLAARPAGLTGRQARRIGLASLPQAGVSVGLAALASAALPGRGIATIPLSAIVIFELAGSLIVRSLLPRRRSPPAPRVRPTVAREAA